MIRVYWKAEHGPTEGQDDGFTEYKTVEAARDAMLNNFTEYDDNPVEAVIRNYGKPSEEPLIVNWNVTLLPQNTKRKVTIMASTRV